MLDFRMGVAGLLGMLVRSFRVRAGRASKSDSAPPCGDAWILALHRACQSRGTYLYVSRECYHISTSYFRAYFEDLGVVLLVRAFC